jgi:hypothetical protein
VLDEMEVGKNQFYTILCQFALRSFLVEIFDLLIMRPVLKYQIYRGGID